MALAKALKSHVINDYAVASGDTGSTSVQIALLTERIKQLTQHLGENKKDFSSKRGLIRAVEQRRKLLAYYKRTNSGQYKELIDRLGLRK